MKSQVAILKNLESQWDVFLNLSHELACIISNEGIFKKVNNIFTDETGFLPSELVQQPLNKFIHPDEYNTLEPLTQLSNNTIVHFENRFICKNNIYKRLSWNASKVGNEYIYTSAKNLDSIPNHIEFNITNPQFENEKQNKGLKQINAKKLKNSEENYKILFLNNPVPMYAYNLQDLKIKAVNQAAIHLYGYTREEFLGLNIFDLRLKVEHPRLKKLVDEKLFFKNFTNYGEWLHLKKDQSIVPVELISQLIEINGKKTRLVVVSDVTEKKKAQQEILEQNQKLREIAQISSHELRGPVASILGLVNLLNKRKLTSEFNKEIITCLDISAHELDKVIHDIVDKTWTNEFGLVK